MAEISIVYRNGMADAKPLCDDDEDEEPGRILTVEEFMERLRNRSDIFGVYKNRSLRNAEVVALAFAVAAGFLVSYCKPMDAVGKLLLPLDGGDCPPVSVLPGTIGRPDRQAAVAPPAVSDKSRPSLRRPRRPAVNQSGASGPTGGGTIRERIARTGILGALADKTRGKDAATGDIFGKGGFAEGIDAIIDGVQGLKQGGSSAASRMGPRGIGFTAAYGPSGFGGNNPGGIDAMMSPLMKPAESEMPLSFKTGPPDRLGKAVIAQVTGGFAFRGEGRSKTDVMRVVLQNLSALRYSYNQRLRDRPGLTGRITIKFAVDEFGNVIACEILGSSMNDGCLEMNIVGKILRWRFDKIDKPGEITEVVYPFVFST